MELHAQHFGDITLVSVNENRIDAAGAIAFKDQLRAVSQVGAARVIVDMCKVDFVDSSGLGAIVGAMKLLAPDRKLELAGLTPMVEKVFHLTRMDTIFTIHRTADHFATGHQAAG